MERFTLEVLRGTTLSGVKLTDDMNAAKLMSFWNVANFVSFN